MKLSVSERIWYFVVVICLDMTPVLSLITPEQFYLLLKTLKTSKFGIMGCSVTFSINKMSFPDF